LAEVISDILVTLTFYQKCQWKLPIGFEQIMAGDLPDSSKKQSAGVPDVSRIIKGIFKNLPASPN
jgi:hypothetical protein